MTNSANFQPAVTTANLSDAISQATTVTDYAQASITAVPSLQSTEDWMAQVEADVASAQTHAQNWLSNICPAITGKMPGDIIAFNTDFQPASGVVLSTLQAINSQPGGIPTADQKETISTALNSLISGINTLKQAADLLLKEIGIFASDLNTDQQQLANDLAFVVTKYANGASYVNEISAIIGEKFINSNVLGPCSTIVMVDMSISIKVNQTGCAPDLISIIYSKAILATQVGNLQASQLSAQTILDSWTILSKKVVDVVNDLNAVPADSYSAFIEQLDISNAQLQWQQLADYALTLISNA